MPASLLIIDDEKHTREGLATALEDTYDVYTASGAPQAYNLLESAGPFDLVLTDLRMPGPSGLKIIAHALQTQQPNPPACILMTAYGDMQTAVEAMKRGASDFLTKPLDLNALEAILASTLKKHQAKLAAHKKDTAPQQKAAPAKTTSAKINNNMPKILGSAPALKAALAAVEKAAPAKASVLLTGQTGTGKELFASALHAHSPRASGPFVPVHCAALAPTLLESELFGHEKGAFTGADAQRIGRFEAANGGTLFLDEIGEIDAATQVKLLRVLETRTVERLGGSAPVPINVRIVSATHRNLAQRVASGHFREDLLYRLSVIPIAVPTLSQRASDIPGLLEHYLNVFAKENETVAPTLSPEALHILCTYSWPGNVRELRNVCEHAAVMHAGTTLTPQHLDGRFSAPSTPETNAAGSEPTTTNTTPTENEGVNSASNLPTLNKTDAEKQRIAQALQQTGGNRSEAAKVLGISRRTLHRKLIKWPELG